MGQTESEFQWANDSTDAAQLLADGNLTDVLIAEKIGVARSTLSRWKTHPEFQARIDEILEAYRVETRRLGLSNRDRRIRAINDRWNRLQRVLEDRADDQSLKDVPGGSTGLIVHDIKGVGKGEDFQLVDLYSVDTATLRELREMEKQAAQELGQWVEKREVDQTVKSYAVDNSPDDL